MDLYSFDFYKKSADYVKERIPFTPEIENPVVTILPTDMLEVFPQNKWTKPSNW